VSLFESDAQSASRTPLAVRMRPRTFEELVGQGKALSVGGPVEQLLSGNSSVSVILWGPPGSGKTTIASLLSAHSGSRFQELSAVTAGVKDVRAVIDSAREQMSLYARGTVLFVDEVHRFSKSQQDALLPAVENGWVTLVAATTENPSFSIISPLLSRSVVVQLALLDGQALGHILDRALVSERGLNGQWSVTEAARDLIIDASSGDARRALTALEASANAASARSSDVIDAEDVHTAVAVVALNYDKDGDSHYDVISAYIKSMRGSDPNAALHYLARMLHGGEDPRFIARRLMILASEDIGLADSSVLPLTVAAAQSVALIGMPEAQIILAHATIACAMAPKSNSVVAAIGSAMADVERGRVGTVPDHLRDGHYAGAAGLGLGVGYKYPHDFDSGVAAQEYLPDVLRGADYFQPTSHGAEERLATIAQRLTMLREGRSLD
jgi:putative ATPase